MLPRCLPVIFLFALAVTDLRAGPTPPDSLRTNAVPQATPGNWFVQVGAFVKSENAYRLTAELAREGYGTDLYALISKRRQLLCVRVGGFETAEACRAALRKLQRQHHFPGFIVTR